MCSSGWVSERVSTPSCIACRHSLFCDHAVFPSTLEAHPWHTDSDSSCSLTAVPGYRPCQQVSFAVRLVLFSAHSCLFESLGQGLHVLLVTLARLLSLLCNGFLGSGVTMCRLDFLGAVCPVCRLDFLGVVCPLCRLNSLGVACPVCRLDSLGMACPVCRLDSLGMACLVCRLDSLGMVCPVCRQGFLGCGVPCVQTADAPLMAVSSGPHRFCKE